MSIKAEAERCVMLTINGVAHPLKLSEARRVAAELQRAINGFGNKRVIDACKSVVCTRYRLTEDEIDARQRPERIVKPRQIAMTIAREFEFMTLERVGMGFRNGMDHATVLHAQHAVQAMRDTVQGFEAEYQEMVGEVTMLVGTSAKKRSFNLPVNTSVNTKVAASQ